VSGDKEYFDLLFQKELIFLNEHFEDQADLFQKISERLYSQSYVDSGFLLSLQTREKEYPTGLHAPAFDVAIPHTDPVHIKRPFIVAVRPDPPLDFQAMGMEQDHVDAALIFILGLQREGNQVLLLQKLMDLFLDEQKMKQLLRIADQEEWLKEIQYFIKGRD